MRISDATKTAWRGIMNAKARSFLTMLGIVIGIGSVIVLMSIGSSAEKLILSEIEGIGSNLVFITPGATKGSKFASPAAFLGITIKTLQDKDLESLRREASIERVTAEVRGQAKVVYESNDVTITFTGNDQEYFAIRNFKFDAGGPLSATDVSSFNRVAVLGSEIAKTLFGNTDPIGKNIRLKDLSFRVVGVLAGEGVGPFGIDQDNLIMVPVSVAQKVMLGINYYNAVTTQVKDSYDITFAKGRIESTLRFNHRITDPNKDDFTVQTQEDFIAILGNVTGILTVFLTAVASISLVVGGIGIMNIMLVSVVERTREIGLRKALGARNRDIVLQFLIESVVLTCVGGIIGIIGGIGITFIIYIVLTQFLNTGWFFSIPVSGVFISFTVAALTGLLFGIYPARKAAQKNPIEALRYE
jgi:putative ABC transport system permease protein